MVAEIQQLLDQYQLWLRDRTALREVNGWVEITTPYLDRHNDYLQLYAQSGNGSVTITDDGYTIRDLETSGCQLNTSKRRELLAMVLNGFGVRLNDGNLEVRATRDDFAQRKHNLVQAVLAVNDLFYLSEPMVRSFFYEDVIAWLDDAGIRHIANVKMTGKSGYDHRFDIVIPKSRIAPERVVRPIAQPSRETAESFIHAWTDTREVRPPESRAFAFLNDGEPVRPGVVEALQRYAIQPVLWHEREQALKDLAA